MKKRIGSMTGLVLAIVCVFVLASVASGDTRATDAVSALRQLPDEGGALIGDAMKRSPALMQGVAALRAGALADSIGALGEAVREAGNTGAVARYFYAEALARLGKAGNALFYYNEFLSNWPGHPLADDVLLGIALVYIEAGRMNDAEPWLRRMLTDCPQGDRLPLARLLLEGRTFSGHPGASSQTPDAKQNLKSTSPAATMDVREDGLHARSKTLDDRESSLDARERLIADAEKKLEVDRKRVIAMEGLVLAKKQHLDTREKALDARASALDKREKELKDFENR